MFAFICNSYTILKAQNASKGIPVGLLKMEKYKNKHTTHTHQVKEAWLFHNVFMLESKTFSFTITINNIDIISVIY